MTTGYWTNTWGCWYLLLHSNMMGILVKEQATKPPNKTDWLAIIYSFHTKTCIHGISRHILSEISVSPHTLNSTDSRIGANLILIMDIGCSCGGGYNLNTSHSISFTCTWVPAYISEGQMKKWAHGWQQICGRGVWGTAVNSFPIWPS